MSGSTDPNHTGWPLICPQPFADMRVGGGQDFAGQADRYRPFQADDVGLILINSQAHAAHVSPLPGLSSCPALVHVVLSLTRRMPNVGSAQGDFGKTMTSQRCVPSSSADPGDHRVRLASADGSTTRISVPAGDRQPAGSPAPRRSCRLPAHRRCSCRQSMITSRPSTCHLSAEMAWIVPSNSTGGVSGFERQDLGRKRTQDVALLHCDDRYQRTDLGCPLITVSWGDLDELLLNHPPCPSVFATRPRFGRRGLTTRPGVNLDDFGVNLAVFDSAGPRR